MVAGVNGAAAHLENIVALFIVAPVEGACVGAGVGAGVKLASGMEYVGEPWYPWPPILVPQPPKPKPKPEE